MTTSFQHKTQIFVKETEAWKADHDEVMARYECAGDLSVSIFKLVEAYNNFKAIQVHAPISVSHSRACSEFQLAWYEYAVTLANAGDELARDEYEVDGLESLHSSISEVSAYIAMIRGHLESLDEFENGNGIPVQG